jgi:hypothetical protein
MVMVRVISTPHPYPGLGEGKGGGDDRGGG